MVPFARLEAYCAFARGSPFKFISGKPTVLFRTIMCNLPLQNHQLTGVFIVCTNFSFVCATIRANLLEIRGEKMDKIFERLAKQLKQKNEWLTIDEARTWVELLWEDFESTRAKAGRQYQGKAVTERIVTQWIHNYGPRLHEFASQNPKFKKLLH